MRGLNRLRKLLYKKESTSKFLCRNKIQREKSKKIIHSIKALPYKAGCLAVRVKGLCQQAGEASCGVPAVQQSGRKRDKRQVGKGSNHHTQK